MANEVRAILVNILLIKFKLFWRIYSVIDDFKKNHNIELSKAKSDMYFDKTYGNVYKTNCDNMMIFKDRDYRVSTLSFLILPLYLQTGFHTA